MPRNIMDHDEATDSIDRKDGTLMATIATPLRIGLADRVCGISCFHNLLCDNCCVPVADFRKDAFS